MHFARLVEQASATRFLRPICLSQTWSITDLVATYLSLELDETSELPLYNPAVSRKKDFIERPYNLRPRNRKTVNSQAVLVSTRL